MRVEKLMGLAERIVWGNVAGLVMRIQFWKLLGNDYEPHEGRLGRRNVA